MADGPDARLRRSGECSTGARFVSAVVKIVERYVHEKVKPVSPAEKEDVFLSPYYGWVIERLSAAIRPDASQGEAPEVPRYESNRGPGTTADVDFRTARDVREVVKSHLNYVVADTANGSSRRHITSTHLGDLLS